MVKSKITISIRREGLYWYPKRKHVVGIQEVYNSADYCRCKILTGQPTGCGIECVSLDYALKHFVPLECKLPERVSVRGAILDYRGPRVGEAYVTRTGRNVYWRNPKTQMMGYDTRRLIVDASVVKPENTLVRIDTCASNDDSGRELSDYIASEMQRLKKMVGVDIGVAERSVLSVYQVKQEDSMLEYSVAKIKSKLEKAKEERIAEAEVLIDSGNQPVMDAVKEYLSNDSHDPVSALILTDMPKDLTAKYDQALDILDTLASDTVAAGDLDFDYQKLVNAAKDISGFCKRVVIGAGASL